MSTFHVNACPVCRSRFDELCARVLMPAEYDPVRCACGAVISWRYQIGPNLWTRQKVTR